ncbi:MAG TPA: glycosyltransferase family 2 protein [Bryobacteraceae bacterium]|nr:glycosyltransferase family 2 protein [Bryobacteraceae bacterium]
MLVWGTGRSDLDRVIRLQVSVPSFTISCNVIEARSSISIIIAAFNASQTLHKTLEAVKLSSVRPLDIIVIDDSSTEDTAAVARQHGCTVLSTDRRSGPGYARNLGAAQAQGDVLVFLDADVRLHGDSLRLLVAHLDDLGIGAAFGAYDENPLDAGFFSRYRNLLHCHTHRVGRAEASTFWAGFGAIRRELFREFGGFDESYDSASIEDIELGMRLKAAGVRIRLDPRAEAQHLKRWTFPEMSRTDIFRRGIPWTRLILKTRRMPNDLNLRWSQRVSVAAAWIALGACTGHVQLMLAALVVVAVCNGRFLGFLKERAGLSFAIGAFPVQVVFSVYCGLSLVAGTVLHLKSLMAPRKAKEVATKPEELTEAEQEVA